jgi:hypothetical protein
MTIIISGSLLMPYFTTEPLSGGSILLCGG